jgi:(4-(4-[2-(gamma-L-glutamylamino)ethyl]phenoxymethyl)furan-2-yl)methanamine synthase
MSPFVIGLDVGGANLKAANTEGQARSQPFELWKNPAGLGDALRRLIEGWRWPEQFAVTMTGELCDCFETKREGVVAILDAVQRVAGDTPVRVWTNQGRFVDLPAAKADPLPCAAANWLALATFVGRYAPYGAGLLFDIGSTTTDLVPLSSGRPVPRGRTDRERLKCRELVYTGVRRTPVCALLRRGVAAEVFATMLDAYLLLELMPQSADDHNTADGRPATREMAHARMARMLCDDAESVTVQETRDLAEKARDQQMYLLNRAYIHLAEIHGGQFETVVLCGEGEFLARKLVEERAHVRHGCAVSLRDLLGPEISRAACAHAVAVLAAEER